jgi:WLM domain
MKESIMVFSYYHQLTPGQKRIYRQSDSVSAVPLQASASLSRLIPELEHALTADDRTKIQEVCQALAEGITSCLSVPAIRVRVLAVRPKQSWGELHGLYEAAEGRATALITLWMRTAQHRRIVAFRSFLRTLLHELCHHLDYDLFKLADSFHTEGFYKRESSLFHQLMKKE